MKVAYLFSRYPVPSQTFCDTEIRALENAGLEIEIYSCSPPKTSFRHGVEDWPRAQVFYAPPPDGLAWWEAAARAEGSWPEDAVARHEAIYGTRYEPSKRVRHAVYFADLLRRRGIEHLHVHFANRATHAALFVHELTGIPFSFTAHAQDFLVDLGSDALLAELCEQATFVVAVSEWSRRALLKKCPAAAGKIHRIYNGLPLARWPEPAPVADPDGTLKIFGVGRLIEFKGFADLIAACAILHERGIPLQCEIAGEGPLQETLEHQIAALGGPSSVRLAGLLSQDQVRARLAACDVFVLPCRVDAKGASDVLPTVILEAMAAGRPVVSTRLAAVPEMVDDGRTGLLVEPGDITALADALAQLASHRNVREDHGGAARKKLVSSFSADDSARQLAALFMAHKTGHASGPRPVPGSLVTPPTLCLYDRWPDSTHLHHGSPGLRLLALKTAGAPSAGLGQGATANVSFSLLPTLEFLPDAFVLESCWRAYPDWANRIESWRSELGNACDTDDFLRAARRALYLKFDLARGPLVHHLHAVGPDASLCAWLLKRLDAVESISLLLTSDDHAPRLAGSTLRKLAPAFVGGWVVGERKLAATLGSRFRFDQPGAETWRSAVEGWSSE